MRRRISLVLAMASPPACAPELLQRGLCKVHDLLAHLVGQRRALLQLLQELGPSGIRVNAVAPGVIQTDMCAHVDPSVMEGLRQQTPIERLGTPEDIARAMVYLADAEFVTGQVLPVNGGFVIT